jgi:hypothetical protein
LLVASAVLCVPLALTLGSTVRDDVDAIREHSRLSAVEAKVVPPFGFGASRNVPLLLGIPIVPDDASVSFLPRAATWRRIFVQTGWIRWVRQWSRRAGRRGRARLGPFSSAVAREARGSGTAGWRFGRDWLVER